MKMKIKAWLSLLFWGSVLGLTTLTPRSARAQETPADRAYHQAQRQQEQMMLAAASSGCGLIVRAKINVAIALKSQGYSRAVSNEIIAEQLSQQDGYDDSLVEQLMLANGVSKSAMVDSITGSIYRNPHPSMMDLDPVSKRFETEFDRKACKTRGKPLQQK